MSVMPWIVMDHEHTEDDPGQDNLCFKASVPAINSRVVFSR